MALAPARPGDAADPGRPAEPEHAVPAPAMTPGAEQSRAAYPVRSGHVERHGVKVFYEVYGEGERTLLLLPTWSIVHSRHWKAQIPYLSRHCRVLTFDGRGNGRSDRPRGGAAYGVREFAADALAVLDATGTRSAHVAGISLGTQWAILLAAEHPERVDGAVLIGNSTPLAPTHPGRKICARFDEPIDSDEPWERYNAHAWRKDFRGFLEFFFSQCFTEAHSTKQIEDCVGWGLETDPETLIDTTRGDCPSREELLAMCRRVKCPVLVIHGSDDAISPHRRAVVLAEATRAELVTIDGGGHLPQARDPVKVNLLLRDFVCPPARSARWGRARRRRRRALFLSSPIGLGHAQRDIAIADELRKLHPDLEIDWLAQHPVTAVLEARGERIHPGSRALASESRHIESESHEHDLHCFRAWRRMDEILVSNFMVFHDVVRDTPYDLWIGDEAWELDYYLHENPEEKRAAYAWLTDFVGWLPMPSGGAPEARLTADYNAEMIGHIARFPRLRDRAIYVGSPDDIVPDRFGPDLPTIREWTEDHFEFSGYVTGYDPRELGDRAALRASLGFAPDEKVCIATVGGSGVGRALLHRVIASYPEARRRVPELRMIVVAGPRIDPASLAAPEGLEVRPFVPQLYRHLAACDVAIVQGGLTTTMELTASRRPFLYFPLRDHFEQTFHVRHRLARYGAGREMAYDRSGPEQIAEALVEELRRPVRYRAVETDGAARAAASIAGLL